MKQLPLVSVITPSFEQGRFLKQTITSVLSQDYWPREFVVVDGGSHDGTIEILRSYKERDLRFVSEPDGGQSHAVNKGLKMTSGPIIGWLNSDDCYLPGAMRTVVEVFAEHPNAAVVYGDFIKIDGDGSIISLRRRPSFDRNVCTFAHITLPQPATFIRREALEAVGGLLEHLHMAMDFDLWICLAKQGEFVHVRRYIAAFRVHPESKSEASRAAQRQEVIQIRKRHYPRLGTLGMRFRQAYYWSKAAYLLGRDNCLLSLIGLEHDEPQYAELLRRRASVSQLWAHSETSQS